MAAHADELEATQQAVFDKYPRGSKPGPPDIFVAPWAMPSGRHLSSFSLLRSACRELMARCYAAGAPELVGESVLAYVRAADQADRDQAAAAEREKNRMQAVTAAQSRHMDWLRSHRNPDRVRVEDSRSVNNPA